MERPFNICKSVKDAFIYDNYRNFVSPFKLKYVPALAVCPARSAIVLFRLQQYFFWKGKEYKGIISKLYNSLSIVVGRLNFVLNAGFEPSVFSDVSSGLFIHHTQGVIIGGDTKIGFNCHLFKNILLGEKNGYYPCIKSNVTIYANAVIVGSVTVNDHAVIAPNSVVIHDVPEGTIVGGIPAKPIGENSYCFVKEQRGPITLQRNEISSE